MNIENVKQIFESPAMGTDKPTTKSNLNPILIGIMVVLGIAVFLFKKKNERLCKWLKKTKYVC